MDRKRGDLNERFHLERLIGTGKFGSVYEAEQLEGLLAGRKCAVKLLDIGQRRDDGRHGSRRVRFRREIQLFTKLRGAHIVNVIDADEDSDGTLWFAMDLVAGSDLSRYVSEKEPLPTATALEIAAQAADGLGLAHDRGVVHRDVKPQNILVERMGDRPHVYVTDFGIAKFIEDETITQSLDSPHTPVYGAPEQFGSGEISRETDVCGLGRTLFNLVTGELPPRVGAPLPLAGLDPPLADLLRKATRQEPALRPTMQEVGDACRALAAHYQRAPSAAEDIRAADAEASTEDGEAATATPPRPRRDRALSRRAFAALAATVLAAGVVVGVASGDESPAPSTASAGPLRVSYSSPWTASAPRAEPMAGLTVSDPATLVEGRGSRHFFTMGMLEHPRGGADPVPPKVARGLGGSPRLFRLGDIGGLAYGSSDSATNHLLAIPTSAGWAVIVCTAPVGERRRFSKACESLAATATLSGARLQALQPDPGYAQALTATIGEVDRARRKATDAMRSRSLSKRAAATGVAARAYGRSARALARRDPRLQDRAGQGRLVDGLRLTAAGFDELSQAARRRSASAYRRAAAKVATGDGRVRRGLGELTAAGYRIVGRDGADKRDGGS